MIRHYFIAASLIILGLLSYSCNLVGGDKSYNLTTTVSPEEGGTIDPPSGSYESGVQLSVRANPSEGWRFDRWEGDFLNITVNPVNISMTKDHNVIAVFEPRDYPLHISIKGEGVVEEKIVQQKSTEYPFGTIVQLTAVPQEGWQFGYWEGDVETNENPTIIEITNDNNVTAVFEPIAYELAISVEGEGQVLEELLHSKTNEYPFGSVVNLTAVPGDSWRFQHWRGDITTSSNPVQVVIDDHKQVTAVFVEKKDFPLQDFLDREISFMFFGVEESHDGFYTYVTLLIKESHEVLSLQVDGNNIELSFYHGYYIAEPNLLPGQEFTYRLRIDDNIRTGRLTVPDAIRGSFPESFNFLDNYVMSWTTSSDPAGYIALLHIGFDQDDEWLDHGQLLNGSARNHTFNSSIYSGLTEDDVWYIDAGVLGMNFDINDDMLIMAAFDEYEVYIFDDFIGLRQSEKRVADDRQRGRFPAVLSRMP